ncbi:hypothetical protein QTO34_008838 [Cnephaeus nilssonii]|uniref:Uncharacterized protein n=1 Tax=Cnephaeus nilssonii TaxID=3371016 RepID=A0AA40HGP2_CNENI|nr:hypothetical protein QTO34_008838 [Eptesicus nilssonii]
MTLVQFSGSKIYDFLMPSIHPCAVKQSFDLEEYSLSQSTLEQVGPRQCDTLSLSFPPRQVFLELSKEQELQDFDEEVDLSVRWKLLQQKEPLRLLIVL